MQREVQTVKAEDQDNTSGDVFDSITISGGNVGAIGGRGHQIQQGIPVEKQKADVLADSSTRPAPEPGLVAVPGTLRMLMLDAFTAADLRRLFEFSTHAELKEVARSSPRATAWWIWPTR